MKNSNFSVPLNVNESKITVAILEPEFDKLISDKSSQLIVDKYPGFYCFYNKKNKSIYVGESNHPFKRLEEHYRNKKLERNDNILVFWSEQFHKSAIYDIETKIIDYLFSEKNYSLRNLKQNQGSYEYFLKYAYQKVIQKIWSKFIDLEIASKTIEEIKNSQIYKLSPYKNLNIDQYKSVSEILKKDFPLTIINGYPGTGKSIVASYLYANLSKKKKVCLTSGTHPTVKNFQNVFKVHQKEISTNSQIWKTSQLIKSGQKFETIIIDEGHRLMKHDGKGHPVKFKHLKKNQNELEMITKIAKNVILLYDSNQIVHDADFSLNDTNINKKTRKFDLSQQMRSMSNDYVNWCIKWLNNDFEEINKNNGDYDFEFFDSFSQMYYALKEKTKKYKLTRLVSGYTREWKSKNNPEVFDFEIDGIKLRWNNQKTANKYKWIDSDPAKNLQEIGYYHLIQGFDLNYVGVIIGEDLYLDENDEIQVRDEKVGHPNEKPKKSDPDYDGKLKQWILNRYKILLSRGIKGAYVFIEDTKLRNKIKSLINNH